MQPVTIIRVQTPVCAVPGCFCPSAAIVRCAGYATHTSPARAPPRRSCRATTSSLSRPTYLLLPAPSRAAPHRREKKRKQTRRAPRRTPHPRPPLFCPLCFAPFGRPFLFATRRGRLATVASFSRTLIYTTNRACWACPAFSLARVLCLLLGQLLLR